jgi:ankyrin repeat protein
VCGFASLAIMNCKHNNIDGLAALIESIPASYKFPVCIDANGNTPLHWAAGNGSAKAIELLIEAKANVNITDSLGKTYVRYLLTLTTAGRCLLLLKETSL